MARPIKRKGTENAYYRRRIPAKAKRALGSLPASYRPAGWGKDEIVISLGTGKRSEIAEAHARVAQEVEKRLASLEKGTRPLSHKDAVALSGLLYRAFAETLENNPGLPSRWAMVLLRNDRAQEGRLGSSLTIPTEARRRADLEKVFGPLADAMLGRECILTDAESRWRVIEETARAMDDAARKLKRNAGGDYRPDETAARFPTWEGTEAKPKGSLSVMQVFERWKKANPRGSAASSINRFEPVFRSLHAFAVGKKRGAAELTGDDIYRWAQTRVEGETRTPRTVNRIELAAVRSVFGWASGQSGGRIIPDNAAHGVNLDGPGAKRKPKERDRYFNAAEVAAVLGAALAVKDDADNPTLPYACRWTPWLAAYSGARIGELTQLRGKDVCREGKTWFMHITPEAGTVKTNQARKVPLHEHVIALGFLSFVEVRGDGPLFYDPRRHREGSKTSPAAIRAQHVAKWVRATVALDPRLQPNHAWRHTFKTRAMGFGIDMRVRDGIAGHEPGTVARAYESVPLREAAKAIERFQRYSLDPDNDASNEI